MVRRRDEVTVRGKAGRGAAATDGLLSNRPPSMHTSGRTRPINALRVKRMTGDERLDIYFTPPRYGALQLPDNQAKGTFHKTTDLKVVQTEPQG